MHNLRLVALSSPPGRASVQFACRIAQSKPHSNTMDGSLGEQPAGNGRAIYDHSATAKACCQKNGEVERLRLLQQDINAQCLKSTRHRFNLKHAAFSSSECLTQMQLIGSKKYGNTIQIPSRPKKTQIIG